MFAVREPEKNRSEGNINVIPLGGTAPSWPGLGVSPDRKGDAFVVVIRDLLFSYVSKKLFKTFPSQES